MGWDFEVVVSLMREREDERFIATMVLGFLAVV